MAKRVILAKAGSGKTYYICKNIDPSERNLILAFTNENIYNIKREIINIYGSIPRNTCVQTYHSFLYQELLLPYEASISKKFNIEGLKSCGISLKEPPKRTDRQKKLNYGYVAKDKIGHYINGKNQYYCARMSELIVEMGDNFLKKIINRINLFFDNVLIDEFQDFRCHDYELLISITRNLPKTLLVGDYYQHSVSGQNNTGKPFKRRNKNEPYLPIQEYIVSLQNLGFYVDCESLRSSRRCSPCICDFIMKKLQIEITSSNISHGKVSIVEDNEAEKILQDDDIVKLVYEKAMDYKFKAINWSYSKGNTYKRTCVILTDSFSKLTSDDFTIKDKSQLSINKLYVALTRSSGDVLIMQSSTFKKYKGSYLNNSSRKGHV